MSSPVSDVTPPESTSSKTTLAIGGLAVVSTVVFAIFALSVAEPHHEQAQAVRLLFIHVPSALVTYVMFLVTLFASGMYLRKKSLYWDLLAGAAAEVGVVYCAILLFTGSVWGKPTWGTYWQWDPRLTSTAVMFIMYLGYLGLRSADLPLDTRRKRSAIVGIVSFLNVIIVHYSIDWWRGLHQGRTFETSNVQIEGWYLFSFTLGLVSASLVAMWLVIHRFRVGWLLEQLRLVEVEAAMTDRVSEANTLNLQGGVAATESRVN